MLAKRRGDRAPPRLTAIKRRRAHVRSVLNTAAHHRNFSIARSIICSLDCGLAINGAVASVVGACAVRPAGTLICWQRSHSALRLVLRPVPLS